MKMSGSIDSIVRGSTMVAGCPKCNARYRVNAERIGPDGAKLRCTKCSAVFLVRTPQGLPEPPPAAPDPSPIPDPDIDPQRLVLVADPDEARGKSTANAIEGWGLTPLLVHDGVEAMLAIQRTLPATIVLDAGLPKMFGFQICEVVKRNESLRNTQVVLVGAIHHQDRYRRDPSELYGADVYIESPDLPDGLLPLLRDAGLSVPDSSGDGPVSPKPAPQADASPQPTPEASREAAQKPPSQPRPELKLDLGTDAPSMEMPSPAASSEPAMVTEAEDPERTAERERAQRLARIAVSEMVLYQPEKFDQATRDGTLEQALDLEIQEARALLRQRIGEEVRAETDFIIDELSRVAQERGGQG
jgi:predicted Zn finger-like uncharacterized protein